MTMGEAARGIRQPAVLWPNLRWSAARCLLLIAAILSVAAALTIAALAPVAALLGGTEPGAVMVVWLPAALLMGTGGCIMAAMAARRLTPDLICVCSLDGSVDLHMHPAAFGFANGRLRHAQAVRLLRALQGLAEQRVPDAVPGISSGRVTVRIISQLCEARIMRRLGYVPVPTPAWKVLALRSAFSVMAAVVHARRRRMIHRDQRNWAVTWTMTIRVDPGAGF